MRNFASSWVVVACASLALVACQTVDVEPTDDDGAGANGGGGNGDGAGGDGAGGGGGGGSCTDPGAVLGWTVELPDGEVIASDDAPAEQIEKPFDASGRVSLDGNTVIIGDPDSDLRFSLRDGQSPLAVGLVEGTSVTATGTISSVVYPGSPVEWRLAMRVDNDPAGGGTEDGERLWLLVAGVGVVDTTPFVIDYEDNTCELDGFYFQSRWLVSGPDAVSPVAIAEGESAPFTVSGGPHAGDYEALGFNATFPLEGTAVTNLVVRRAP